MISRQNRRVEAFLLLERTPLASGQEEFRERRNRENDQDQKQRAEQAGSPSHSPITVHRCHPSLPASEDQDLVSRGRCCSERVHPRERRSRKDDA